jgi:hydrogenase nickel incorporation protein HypA/HybF
MHEMALAENVVQIITEQAHARDFSRVTMVRLSIGAMSDVEPEAMAFCFDAATRGTPAEGARLEIDRPPGTGWCMECSQSVAVSARADPCPLCGGHKIQVTGGTEMRIAELEVA